MTRIRFGLLLFVQITLISGGPYLQTIQNLSVYVPSDDITLLCCSQYSLGQQIFEFYKGDSMIHLTEDDKNCASYTFNIKALQDTGPYYCAYKVLENGTYVQSNMSDPFTFQFADTPLPPSIILAPSFPVFTTKESMDLTCAPPKDTTAKGIQIFREESKIHEEVLLKKKYTISASDKDAAGKYYCKYWVEMYGRSIISLPSEHITVNVTSMPPAPSLSMSTEHSVYIKGEAVTLTCFFPLGVKVKDVQFYRDGELFPITNSRQKNTHVMATLDVVKTATFTCQYYEEISGRTIASDLSNEITINTTEPLPSPSITLEPSQPVYIIGEAVSIICSVPHNTEGQLKSIKFYRSGQNIHTKESCETRCIYTLSNPTKQFNGEYSCEYWMSKDGRELSAHSHGVQAQFTDIPQMPSINLTPQRPVYLMGETVSMSCSLPEQSTTISIQYFKDKQEIYKLNEPKTTSTYTISHLSLENTGSYSCQYWLNYFGRHISSPRSLPIPINVEEIPQSPSIVLNPLFPVYTTGESISIKCLPPDGSEVIHIQYFKNDKLFYTTLEKLYVISSLSLEKEGRYSCGYMSNLHGRQIFSKPSQSLSIRVVVIPQVPSIILNPMRSVYIKGETVSITCSLPEEPTVISIQYFKDDQEIHKSETPKAVSSYLVSNLSKENTGQYKCQYWVNTSERNISSHASLPTSIIVEDPPETPVLKLAPNLQIYVSGETLVLTCSGFVNARHHIYKDGKLLQNDFSHLFPSLQLQDNGDYTCTYDFNNRGRQIESSRSQTVKIHVIDPWPAPTLTLGGPIVKLEDGFKLTLNCSAPDDDLLRTFYYFNAIEENPVTNLTAFSASFEFDLGPISHISYVCEYEQEVGGRKIRSRRSQTLPIQLSEASVMSPPVIAGIIGAISLLLCLTLALWFYMKSKKFGTGKKIILQKRPILHAKAATNYEALLRHMQSISIVISPASPVKKIEETNQVLDISGEGQYKIDCPSKLSNADLMTSCDFVSRPAVDLLFTAADFAKYIAKDEILIRMMFFCRFLA
ncbi:Fc receptor-like protein 5 [Leptodactylus fuscus]